MFELLVFRLDELLPAIGASLFAIDLRVELGFETVLVVTESPKFSAINCEGILARENSSEVFLSEVDPSNVVSSGPVDRLGVVLTK